MANIEELKRRYTSIFGEEGCDIGTLKDIERELDVELPLDFVEIATFYSGGYLGGISHHEIASKSVSTNIVEETLRIRESVGLNPNFVVIAEPPESIIVLQVSSAPEVIWCDAVEAKNLNSRKFENDPITWNMYSDFFEYLLDEEDNS